MGPQFYTYFSGVALLMRSLLEKVENDEVGLAFLNDVKKVCLLFLIPVVAQNGAIPESHLIHVGARARERGSAGVNVSSSAIKTNANFFSISRNNPH